MSASEKASLADLSVVIIFSVLDFWVLGSGFWEKRISQNHMLQDFLK
jgi:hypothetical protein